MGIIMHFYTIQTISYYVRGTLIIFVQPQHGTDESTFHMVYLNLQSLFLALFCLLWGW